MRDGRRKRLGLATGTEDPATSNDGYLDRILSDTEATGQSNILNLAQDANVNVRDQRYLNDAYQYYLGGGTGDFADEVAIAPDFTGGELIDTGDGGAGQATSGVDLGNNSGFNAGVTPGPSGFIGLDPDMDINTQDITDYGTYDPPELGGVDGMSGGQATPGAEFADQNPYGGDGTIDYLGADSFPEYQEPAIAGYSGTTTGLEDPFEDIDLSTGRAETIDTRADQPPSLGFGNAPEADIYQDRIMGMANMNQADVIASDANVGFDTPEQTNAIGDAFNSVKDLGIAGIDQLKDSLTALGGKVKEGFDNTIEIGGKTIDLTKSLTGGVLSLVTGLPGIGFALNAIKSDPIDAATKKGLAEQGYGFDDIGRLTDGPMAGYSVESGFGDGIADATLDRIDKIENRSAPQTEDSIEKVGELYDFLGDVTGIKANEAAPQETDLVGDVYGTGTNIDPNIDVADGGAGNPDRDNVESSSGDTYGGQAYGYNEAAEKSNDGGGSSGGGGKIVCTMMNDSYGFGSFRNKIWLKHSRDMAPEYQIGYHKIFLPLVKLSKTNKVLKKILEHIAIHRTIDIRQEARGKTHLLGRVYRKILEPVCYLVGKYAK